MGCLALLGLGLGLSIQTLVLVVQNAFPVAMVGTATASNNYFRQVGATLGMAFIGSSLHTAPPGQHQRRDGRARQGRIRHSRCPRSPRRGSHPRSSPTCLSRCTVSSSRRTTTPWCRCSCGSPHWQSSGSSSCASCPTRHWRRRSKADPAKARARHGRRRLLREPRRIVRRLTTVTSDSLAEKARLKESTHDGTDHTQRPGTEIPDQLTDLGRQGGSRTADRRGTGVSAPLSPAPMFSCSGTSSPKALRSEFGPC